MTGQNVNHKIQHHEILKFKGSATHGIEKCLPFGGFCRKQTTMKVKHVQHSWSKTTNFTMQLTQSRKADECQYGEIFPYFYENIFLALQNIS